MTYSVSLRSFSAFGSTTRQAADTKVRQSTRHSYVRSSSARLLGKLTDPGTTIKRTIVVLSIKAANPLHGGQL